ncbi:MAG: hypothetical protein ACLP22_06925 [Solirubrobacteraceae bacterium]
MRDDLGRLSQEDDVTGSYQAGNFIPRACIHVTLIRAERTTRTAEGAAFRG